MWLIDMGVFLWVFFGKGIFLFIWFIFLFAYFVEGEGVKFCDK